MAFNPTLFPEPVEPAIKRCGIVARSCATGSPILSFPITIINFEFDLTNSLEVIISLNETTSFLILGISIPTTGFPGTGARMRKLSARIASARSSLKERILLTLIPGAGSNSYNVMTGPGRTCTTFPSTPKSASLRSSIEVLIRISSFISSEFSIGKGSCSKLTGGI